MNQDRGYLHYKSQLPNTRTRNRAKSARGNPFSDRGNSFKEYLMRIDSQTIREEFKFQKEIKYRRTEDQQKQSKLHERIQHDLYGKPKKAKRKTKAQKRKERQETLTEFGETSEKRLEMAKTVRHQQDLIKKKYSFSPDNSKSYKQFYKLAMAETDLGALADLTIKEFENFKNQNKDDGKKRQIRSHPKSVETAPERGSASTQKKAKRKIRTTKGEMASIQKRIFSPNKQDQENGVVKAEKLIMLSNIMAGLKTRERKVSAKPRPATSKLTERKIYNRCMSNAGMKREIYTRKNTANQHYRYLDQNICTDMSIISYSQISPRPQTRETRPTTGGFFSQKVRNARPKTSRVKEAPKIQINKIEDMEATEISDPVSV